MIICFSKTTALLQEPKIADGQNKSQQMRHTNIQKNVLLASN